MRPAVLIVNPAASAVTQAAIARVAGALGAGGPVEVVETERPGHATELAASASEESRAIYVFAGDGGFNEVVNGMAGETPVGFVPGGATSVLPRALGLPRDPIACAERIARAEHKRVITLGRATFSPPPPSTPESPTRRRFAFACGVGLDAELVRAVDRRGRANGRRSRDLAFVFELARILAQRRGRLDPVLTVEGHGRYAFAIASNCDPYTYAGRLPVHATPLASFERGIDLFAPARLRPLGVARLAWWALVRPVHPGVEDVLYVHDADRLEIRCDVPLPLELDGEDVGDACELIVEAERAALTVLV